MFFTLKWIIFSRLNTIKEFTTSFLSLNLHGLNFLIWKTIIWLPVFKIITVSRSSTLLWVVLMGGSGCHTAGENSGVLPANQKVWTFPFRWISLPPKTWVPLSPDYRPHSVKKGISNSFSTNFIKKFASKIFPTIKTYLKKLFGTKFLNTKQCPAGNSQSYTPLSS